MKHPLFALVAGIVVLIAVFVFFIGVKAEMQGLDGLAVAGFSAGYLICASPVFLLALAGAAIVISTPKFTLRKDKRK